MHRVLIDSITTFIKTAEDLDVFADQNLFRGQSVEGNLLPTIARADPKLDTSDFEKILLQQLRLQGASLLQTNGLDDLELLIHAQHFGLKTRLLDWTSNPLVALWFACTSNNKEVETKDGYVYALEADKLLTDKVPEDPFKPGSTKIVQPPMNNARIVAQHGWFTLHNYSASAGRFVPLEKNPKIKSKLSEFKIPADKKIELLTSLDKLGISAKTIYPDFNGLCQHLNWKYRNHTLPAL